MLSLLEQYLRFRKAGGDHGVFALRNDLTEEQASDFKKEFSLLCGDSNDISASPTVRDVLNRIRSVFQQVGLAGATGEFSVEYKKNLAALGFMIREELGISEELLVASAENIHLGPKAEAEFKALDAWLKANGA